MIRDTIRVSLALHTHTEFKNVTSARTLQFHLLQIFEGLAQTHRVPPLHRRLPFRVELGVDTIHVARWNVTDGDAVGRRAARVFLHRRRR